MPDKKFILRGSEGSADFDKAHDEADTDVEPNSIHHTLGISGNQAAKGNHNHDKLYSKNGEWTAFPGAGGMTVYGGGYGDPAYRISGDKVEFQGLLLATVTKTAGTPVGTLPVGARPSATRLCHSYISSSLTEFVSCVQIETNGDVKITLADLFADDYVSLDQLWFVL